jgi:hypothetical protein
VRPSWAQRHLYGFPERLVIFSYRCFLDVVPGCGTSWTDRLLLRILDHASSVLRCWYRRVRGRRIGCCWWVLSNIIGVCRWSISGRWTRWTRRLLLHFLRWLGWVPYYRCRCMVIGLGRRNNCCRFLGRTVDSCRKGTAHLRSWCLLRRPGELRSVDARLMSLWRGSSYG